MAPVYGDESVSGNGSEKGVYVQRLDCVQRRGHAQGGACVESSACLAGLR